MTYGQTQTAVLLMSHFVDEGLLAEYRKLRDDLGAAYDVILLLNMAQMPPLPSDVRAWRFDDQAPRSFGYARKGWAVTSYHVDLFPLAFWKANPGYLHVWSVEYDVRFSGNWSALMEAFAGSPADLVGTALRRRAETPHWANWGSLSPPPGITLPERLHLRGFFPINRLSARALQALDEAYRLGWTGHFEATVPTILALEGLEIEDMGGDGPFTRLENRGRFYRNDPARDSLEPGTFVFRPARVAMGGEPDMLWHPVKPTGVESWATGRRARVLRAVRHLARALAARLALPAHQDTGRRGP